MKKIAVILLATLVFVGCGQKAESDPIVEQPEKKPEISIETPTEPKQEAEKMDVVLYLADENAEHFVEKVVKVDVLDQRSIVDALIAEDVLAEGTEVIGFEMGENGQLTIDFNKVFEERIQRTGSTGEYLTVGSVVNTFLKAYEATSVVLKVEGEVPVGGHMIYDEPFQMME